MNHTYDLYETLYSIFRHFTIKINCKFYLFLTANNFFLSIILKLIFNHWFQSSGITRINYLKITYVLIKKNSKMNRSIDFN